MHNQIVAVKNLCKTVNNPAGSLAILQDVDLVIQQGEWLSLLGPSGSGKSTLLHIIAGLEPASSGSVQIAGKELTKLNPDERTSWRGKKIGVVTQSFHLMELLSAAENVALPLTILGESWSRALRGAQEMLRYVGLGSRLNHYPPQLSGGEQQRVAIARAIIHQPMLLVADEPTGNLDRGNSEMVIELFTKLVRDYSIALLMVTHDESIAQRSDRILRMRDGKILQSISNNNSAFADPNSLAANSQSISADATKLNDTYLGNRLVLS